MKRPKKLYGVELLRPHSWRLAMSIEMAANVYPLKRLADAAVRRIRRRGIGARVVVYTRSHVVATRNWLHLAPSDRPSPTRKARGR